MSDDLLIANNVDEKTLEDHQLALQIKNAHYAVAGQIPMMNTYSEIEWVSYVRGGEGLTLTGPYARHSLGLGASQFLTVIEDLSMQQAEDGRGLLLTFHYRNYTVENGLITARSDVQDCYWHEAKVCPEDTEDTGSQDSVASISSASSLSSPSSDSASSASSSASTESSPSSETSSESESSESSASYSSLSSAESEGE